MKKFRQYRRQVAISATIWNEALFGLWRMPTGKRRAMIEEYLFDVIATSIPILAYDGEAAKWHALQRAQLQARGLTPAFADGQIAAVAKCNGLSIVTRNVQDFKVFDEVDLMTWWA